jgi:hypothetical protein
MAKTSTSISFTVSSRRNKPRERVEDLYAVCGQEVLGGDTTQSDSSRFSSSAKRKHAGPFGSEEPVPPLTSPTVDLHCATGTIKGPPIQNGFMNSTAIRRSSYGW